METQGGLFSKYKALFLKILVGQLNTPAPQATGLIDTETTIVEVKACTNCCGSGLFTRRPSGRPSAAIDAIIASFKVRLVTGLDGGMAWVSRIYTPELTEFSCQSIVPQIAASVVNKYSENYATRAVWSWRKANPSLFIKRSLHGTNLFTLASLLSPRDSFSMRCKCNNFTRVKMSWIEYIKKCNIRKNWNTIIA